MYYEDWYGDYYYYPTYINYNYGAGTFPWLWLLLFFPFFFLFFGGFYPFFI